MYHIGLLIQYTGWNKACIGNPIQCTVLAIHALYCITYSVATTKKGLESSGFGRVKFENPTPQEVLHLWHLGFHFLRYSKKAQNSV
jgi:hypothetical protein